MTFHEENGSENAESDIDNATSNKGNYLIKSLNLQDLEDVSYWSILVPNSLCIDIIKICSDAF